MDTAGVRVVASGNTASYCAIMDAGGDLVTAIADMRVLDEITPALLQTQLSESVRTLDRTLAASPLPTRTVSQWRSAAAPPPAPSLALGTHAAPCETQAEETTDCLRMLHSQLERAGAALERAQHRSQHLHQAQLAVESLSISVAT